MKQIEKSFKGQSLQKFVQQKAFRDRYKEMSTELMNYIEQMKDKEEIGQEDNEVDFGDMIVWQDEDDRTVSELIKAGFYGNEEEDM